MRIGRHCDQICPGVVKIGPPADCVKRLQRVFLHDDLNFLVLPGLDRPCLGKSRKLHGRYFHAALYGVLGVGFLQIELHDLFARGLAGIIDVDRDFVSFLSELHLHVPEFERSKGKTEAEGERDFLVIVKHAPRGGAEHGILIPRLIIAVTDVDPLGVDEIVPAVLDFTVFDRIIAQILRRGRAEAVVHKGIRKTSRRIHFSAEHFSQRRHAVFAERAGPQAGVDPVFLKEPHLHGIFRIEHDDHAVEVLCDICEQLLLLRSELQGFRTDHPFRRHFFLQRLFFLLRIYGLIEVRIAPAAANDNDRGFREFLQALFHFLGEIVSAAPVHKFPQFIVDAQLLLFQRRL